MISLYPTHIINVFARSMEIFYRIWLIQFFHSHSKCVIINNLWILWLKCFASMQKYAIIRPLIMRQDSAAKRLCLFIIYQNLLQNIFFCILKLTKLWFNKFIKLTHSFFLGLKSDICDSFISIDMAVSIFILRIFSRAPRNLVEQGRLFRKE